jgi:hypothetical protein
VPAMAFVQSLFQVLWALLGIWFGLKLLELVIVVARTMNA